MSPEDHKHNGCVARWVAVACVVVALTIMVFGIAQFAMPATGALKLEWQLRWGILALNLLMSSCLVYLAWRLVAPPEP